MCLGVLGSEQWAQSRAGVGGGAGECWQTLNSSGAIVATMVSLLYFNVIPFT